MLFVLSEARYLLNAEPHLLPVAVLRNAVKFAAYRIGRQERYLPLWFKRLVSGQPGFWQQQSEIDRAAYPPVAHGVNDAQFLTNDRA